jgi:uncharacterized protein (DUF2062 family)
VAGLPFQLPQAAGIRPGWRGLLDRGRALVARARNEHSTPPEVGFSVGVGVFSACTPLLGFHMWIALALATVFRLNRLWAFLGSRISIVPVYVWISFCEIELGHRVRAGAWVHMSARDALSHGKELSLDWAIGTGLIGCALGAVCGLAAYACARGWSKSRPATVPPELEAPVTTRRLDAPLARSSESPRSEPRGSRP